MIGQSINQSINQSVYKHTNQFIIANIELLNEEEKLIKRKVAQNET